MFRLVNLLFIMCRILGEVGRKPSIPLGYVVGSSTGLWDDGHVPIGLLRF